MKRTLRPAFTGFSLVLVTLLWSPAAPAWPKDVHRSIAQAALVLAPEAALRIPLDQRATFLKEASEPDYVDKDCRFHCSATGALDPAVQAAAIYRQLSDPKRNDRSYTRAQALGRYVHFVADAIGPKAMYSSSSALLNNFFANRDFILFREGRALSTPVETALRTRAMEGLWAGGDERSYAMVFRLVVNTVADALIALPIPAGTNGTPQAAPVIFVVNRMDNGVAARATSGYVKDTSTYHMSDLHTDAYYGSVTTGGYTTTEYRWESHGGGNTVKKSNLLERGGVQLVEVNVNESGPRHLARVLLYNNSDHCAADVELKAGAWSWKVPSTMPPFSIKWAEIEVPADILSRRLSHAYKNDNCSEKPKADDFIATVNRLVVGNPGTPPSFEGGAYQRDITGTRGVSEAEVGKY